MFAWLAKRAIKYYWNSVPEKKRKICIYKITCSRHVYKVFDNKGLISGLIAYFNRMKSCNDGYEIIYQNGKVLIEDRRGRIIREDDINPLIVQEYKNSL